MINIFGFYVYAGYANNDPKVTAKFGEFSNHSASFSRDLRTYTDSAYNKTALLVLSALDDNDAAQPIPQATSSRILQIGQWILDRASSGDIQEDRDQLLQYLREDFQDYIENADVPTPTFNNTVYMPSWISFTLSATGDKIKIWLADEVFQAQYPKFEYVVVPPIPVEKLDTFFEDYDTLKKLIGSRSDDQLAELINEATTPDPYTQLWQKNYNAYDFADDSLVQPSLWTLAIYGAAGFNIDNIKEFLQQWILSHSTHPRDEWEKVLPDLFIPTEHIFIPIWNEHSAPELTNKERIYSPVVDDAKIPTYLTKFADGYGADVRKSMQVVPTLWRSLPFLSVGNPRNRDGKLKFKERWPQYALIRVTDLDINRIDDLTREFIVFTYEMLKLAEALTEEDPLPVSYSRVTRGSNVYLGKSFNDVQYLFLTKESFLAVLPDEG